jgi:TRAP-type C4-dicarboxylate transport system substrate-binding protein
MFNKKWYDSLPADLKKIVEDASRDAAKYQAELRDKLDKEKLQAMINEGVTVNEVDNMKNFRKVQEGYKQKLLEKGPEWVDFYNKLSAVK